MAKPGLGFEIVPDEQTQRKFPSLVTFDEKGERLYGNSASSLVCVLVVGNANGRHSLLTISCSVVDTCGSCRRYVVPPTRFAI
jgi:hypothetical protein